MDGWIHPSQFGAQISVAVTSMLTLIAFQLALGDILPRVPYFPWMDRFILGSSGLVFVARLECVFAGRLAASGHTARGERLDRHARWLFPLAFSVLMISILLA